MVVEIACPVTGPRRGGSCVGLLEETILVRVQREVCVHTYIYIYTCGCVSAYIYIYIDAWRDGIFLSAVAKQRRNLQPMWVVDIRTRNP